jgi:putative acetyltransferase
MYSGGPIVLLIIRPANKRRRNVMSPSASTQIAPAATPEEFAAAQRLLAEYYTWAIAEAGLDTTLTELVPSVANELEHLADHYVPPTAYLLLAWVDDTPVGVCAVERLDPTAAELKRLYVRPDVRGLGIAGRLVTRIAELSEAMGCQTLRLDTHEGIMQPAIALYRRFGFVPAERCTDIDVDHMVGFALDLTTWRAPASASC